MSAQRILLIGFGNPGRCDDGLGPALAQRIESRAMDGVSVEIDYQLTVEHALTIAGFETVIFADAAHPFGKPFRFGAIEGNNPPSLGSHDLSPETLLTLARDLFDARPQAYLLAMEGCRFDDIEEGLTNEATANLDLAIDFLVAWIAEQRSPVMAVKK